jgi:hypothetical protein
MSGGTSACNPSHSLSGASYREPVGHHRSAVCRRAHCRVGILGRVAARLKRSPRKTRQRQSALAFWADHSRSGRVAHPGSDSAQHGRPCRQPKRDSPDSDDRRSGAPRIPADEVPWSTAPRVLAVRSCLCCDDWRARHLRCRRLPPHARSCCTHCSRSVDLCRSHGRGGICRARLRLAFRSHQRSHPGGPAATRCGRAGVGVRRLAADRHCRCAALGCGSCVLDSSIKALGPT